MSLDVIDGQQRIIAMSQFRDDSWALFEIDDPKIALPESIRRQVSPWAGRTFSALSRELQEQFTQVQLAVVMIDEVTGDEVRDLFIRLQAGTPLTPQQVRDAWPGNVGPYIERLAGKGTRQGKYRELFHAVDRRGQGGRSEEEYDDPALDARQTCAQLLSLLLSLEKGRGYPSLTSKALNDVYHEHTELDTEGRTCHTFEELLEQTQSVIALRPDGAGRRTIRKNRVFSLFLFLRLLSFSPVDSRRAINKVAQLFWGEDAEDSEPTGRVGSSKTLEKHFVWFARERMQHLQAPELDSTRLFSPAQKEQIWEAYGGKCGICSELVEPEFAEYDHITPWILGGRTQFENGRPVHQGCHARGLAAVEGHQTPVDQS